MSPLTTPYSGRVVGGGMDAAPTPSAALRPKSVRDRGLTAFSEGPMTHSPRTGLFPYLRYVLGGFIGLGACDVSAFAGSATRSADGRAVK